MGIQAAGRRGYRRRRPSPNRKPLIVAGSTSWRLAIFENNRWCEYTQLKAASQPSARHDDHLNVNTPLTAARAEVWLRANQPTCLGSGRN